MSDFPVGRNVMRERVPARSPSVPPGPWIRLRSAAGRIVEAPGFSAFITALICVNAAVLGLETSDKVMTAAGGILETLDRTALAIFTIEIVLKLIAYGSRFFRSGWNIFDFIIVAIALIPASGAFSILRALRVLRTRRLVSVIPQLRAVIAALFAAIPGMGGILAILLLVFYIAAVMATKLFGTAFPEWFGGVGASMYTLFQVMTLESWSMGIVRPVMATYPWAWTFFVPFIVVTSFTVLNLFIALIVNCLQMIHDAETQQDAVRTDALVKEMHDSVGNQLADLHAQMRSMKSALERLERDR